MPEFEALLADGSILEVFNIPLGKGTCRQAYASAAYPDHVAKTMYYPPAGANALEWQNWCDLKKKGGAMPSGSRLAWPIVLRVTSL